MIRPLAEAAGAMAPLAALMRAEWPDWYGPGGPGTPEADLRARCRKSGLPWGVVALGAGMPVGGAALAHVSHGAAAGETPWLVGLVVAPDRRGQGIGSALVAACEAQARAEGFATLFSTTGAARGLLLRRGWRLLRRLEDGQEVLAKDLSGGAAPPEDGAAGPGQRAGT